MRQAKTKLCDILRNVIRRGISYQIKISHKNLYIFSWSCPIQREFALSLFSLHKIERNYE